MNTKYLLVDGYNIIFYLKDLKILAEKSLDHARTRLMEMLTNFSGFTQENIILVFDAHKVNGGVENIEHKNNIIVVYTREKETADTYIERTAKILAKKYTVRVATSDATEQIIIIGSGAFVVSAPVFEEEVKTALRNISKIAGKRPIKNNLLIDNLDKETMEKLEQMRLKL
ncbi:MAG: NYN domain-containing protein [Defluviitaleaceae bacterium]|nr:NYN domain-containing protein [Defluviitaleaceae bacterium]